MSSANPDNQTNAEAEGRRNGYLIQNWSYICEIWTERAEWFGFSFIGHTSHIKKVEYYYRKNTKWNTQYQIPELVMVSPDTMYLISTSKSVKT